MAFKDKSTKVGFYGSGAGDGGSLSIADKNAPATTGAGNMLDDSYWNLDYTTPTSSDYIADTDERFRVTRKRKAMEDFIRVRASEPAGNANVGGVPITIVGNQNTAAARQNRRAKLHGTTGRIQITN